jgi:hypothetical protein
MLPSDPAEDLDIFQRRFQKIGGVPPDLSIQATDGGKAYLVSLNYRDTQRKSDATRFRIYWLDGSLVAAVDITTAAGFAAASGKKQFVIDAPNTGSQQTMTIPSAPFPSGWFYLVSANAEGKEFPDFSVPPVPLPSDATFFAVPKYEITNPQVSLSNFKVGKAYYDKVTVVYQAPTPLDSFFGVAIFIQNYFNSQNMFATVDADFGRIEEVGEFVYNGSGAGGQGTATFVLEVDDWSGTTEVGPPPHDVNVYFVAFSKSYTHRQDITNAPKVRVIGGIANKQSAPASPVPTALVKGGQVSLSWVEINDQNIDHINIYRKFQGYLNNTNPSTAFPASFPWAVVPKALLNPFMNQWNDVDFNDYNGDNLHSPAPLSVHNDFDNFAPSIIRYWLEAVNDAGVVSASPQTTGDIYLRGIDDTDVNSGASFRDNVWNCLWNAQFNSTTTTVDKSVIAGNQARTPPSNSNGDAYAKWTRTGIATSVFHSNGTKATGEVDIPPVTTGAGNFNNITQDIPISVFLRKGGPGHLHLRRAHRDGSPRGSFR